MKLLSRIAKEARPVTALRRTVANVEAAVMRALERLPADPIESAKAFAAALSDPHVVRSVTTERTGGVVATSAARR